MRGGDEDGEGEELILDLTPSLDKLLAERGKAKLQFDQCCQIVFVKMREKMRQPKMSLFLLHFWTFQRGYKNQSSRIF